MKNTDAHSQFTHPSLLQTIVGALILGLLGLGALMLIPENRLPPLEDNTAPQQAFYPPVED
jgi:hypothetical protein